MNKSYHWLLTTMYSINGKSVLLSWVALMLTFLTYSQDPVFSRYSASPQNENPAFTGGSRNTEVFAVYRNQFPSLSTNYITYSLGFSSFFDELNSGFGLAILHDDSADGLYKTTSAKINYSYRLQLANEAYLNAGLYLGFGRTQVDFNRLIFGDQLDPVTGPISGGGIPFPTEELFPSQEYVNYMDMGAGALFYSEKFYAGLSFHHLNNPTNDFLVSETGTSTGVDGLPLRWTLMAGMTIPLLEHRRETIIAVYPQLLYSRQRGFGELNAGAYLKYKIVDVGASLRLSGTTTDALILTAGLGFDAIKVYYAYDFTISKLGSTSGGAHEVGFTYRIGPVKEIEVSCFDLYR